MIEINLLPQESRKKDQRFKFTDISKINFSKLTLRDIQGLLARLPIISIAAILAGLLVLFHALLFIIGIYCQARYHSLSVKYNVILPEKDEADKLRSESVSINSKVDAINGLMVKRFSWAKKLNSLSDSMTPGVWLSGLSCESSIQEKPAPSAAKPSSGKGKKAGPEPSPVKSTTNSLLISGYSIQVGESGTALVGKFIKSLKNNVDFYSDFNDIALLSIKSDKVENQEVMNFKINCIFKNME